MDLTNAWKNINFEPSAPENDWSKISENSKTPLSKMKKSVLYNLYWGIVITLIYPVLLVYIDEWIIKIGVVLVLLASIMLIRATYNLYKQINPVINPGNNLINELNYQCTIIKRWIALQQKIGLLTYPISITFGFLLGGISSSNLTVFEFLNKPIVLISLLGAIVILTPLCYLLVRWMLNVSFKKELLGLEKLIHSVTSEK